MLKQFCLIGLVLLTNHTKAQGSQQLQQRVALAFDTAVQAIKQNYAYLGHKNINWSCIKNHYPKQIPAIKRADEAILFFEFFLHEFTDNHMTLDTNLNDSYRLYAPVFVKTSPTGFMVHDVWQNQLNSTLGIQVGDVLLTLNGIQTEQLIQNFPAPCLDKSKPANRQWIINKSLAGRYSQPRIIGVSSKGQKKTINLDQLTFKAAEQLLTAHMLKDIGVIRLNNSLGQTALINAFDQAMQKLNPSKGLIIDLRNTISGGDSYIARASIVRFIDEDMAYQKHLFQEQYDGGPPVTRLWTEYVRPRPPIYQKPLVVLTNRWTGSMGEGLAIGLHAMGRGPVMGTQMARLPGAVEDFELPGFSYGYQMPVEQLFHVDGTPRELFKPDTLIQPKDSEADHVLTQALAWLNMRIHAASN